MLYNKDAKTEGTKSSTKLSDLENRGIHYVRLKENC